MGYATCRKCKGSGRFYDSKSGKTFNCRACGGSGSNKNLWTTRCQSCRDEIVYKAETTTPQFCPKCRNKELTKTCAQTGCNNTIKYKVGWTDVSSYCGRCKKKREQGFTASTCPGTGILGCGKVIWSPPGKKFTHCPECNERKRAEEAKLWKEKTCPGLKDQGHCGKTIRYRTDWDRIPDICPDCREKAKRAKADREAKKRTKPCKRCGTTITYYTDGKEYDYCKSCNDLRVRVRPDGNNFQAEDKGKVLFTFGRCRPAKSYAPGQQESDSAKRQREWHERSYWWLSLPGKMHETYIVTKKPVENGFVEASWDDVVAMKTSPGMLLSGFSAITHAIIRWSEYDL